MVRNLEEDLVLDRLDRELLTILQDDATKSYAAMGELFGMTATPCWKRIRRLEHHGYIDRRVAILNRKRLGLGVTVIVAIGISNHSDLWSEIFATIILAIPEILEAHRMSGAMDYILKVVARDIDDFNRILHVINEMSDIRSVSSSFSLHEIKSTTVLPLPN